MSEIYNKPEDILYGTLQGLVDGRMYPNVHIKSKPDEQDFPAITYRSVSIRPLNDARKKLAAQTLGFTLMAKKYTEILDLTDEIWDALNDVRKKDPGGFTDSYVAEFSVHARDFNITLNRY